MGTRSPLRFRIVYRLVPDATAPKEADAIVIGRRANEAVYREAMRRLGRTLYVSFPHVLHNYSARDIGFTHAPENAGLHLRLVEGNVVLHRESFVRDVERAFAADVRADADLRKRAVVHLEQYPPVGDDAGEVELAQPANADEEIRVSDNRRMLIRAVVPAERIEEFVDRPIYGVLEVERAD